LIVLLVDFATAGAVCAAGDCAAAAGAGVAGVGAATGAVAGAAEGAAAFAAGAAAGLAEGVTSLLCDQAPLVGSVMSADNSKIREIFMAKSLDSID